MDHIARDVVASEAADVRLALVQFRDHKPEALHYVTLVREFTKSLRKMQNYLQDVVAAEGM